MCQKPAKRKGFELSGHYQVLTRIRDQSFTWKSIWKTKIPSRVAFSVWTAALGKS